MIERTIIRARALKRLMMWHGFSGRLPLYLVPEFPKSGGTWFSQMLSDCLDLPFPRNSNYARFEKSVLSGHHMYSSNFKNVVVVIRDGRDTTVSAYYYMLFKNEINKQFGVDYNRKKLQFKDYDDIQANLPRFIEYLFVQYPKKGFHFSWAQFIDSWLHRDFPIVRYEDLLVRAADILIEVTGKLTDQPISREKAEAIVDKYSFKKMSGRKQGQENKTSFVRKGIAGDWKNHFTADARKLFDQYAGEQLIKAGYESDHSWVTQSAPDSTSADAVPASSQSN